MSDAIDQHARDEATRALAQISAHERECALRYIGVEKSFKAGSERMKELGQGIKKIDENQRDTERKIIALLLGGGGVTISALFGATWWLGAKLAVLTMKSAGLELP